MKKDEIIEKYGEEEKATNDAAHQAHTHTHSPLLSDHPAISISHATLKLLESFCGDKTYDEVIASLIQKELAEDEH